MSYIVSNTKDYMVRDVLSGVDKTVDGKCSSCGGCCTNFLALTDAEISRIKKYVREHDIRPCSHGFTAPLKEAVVDMICPFRDENKKICTVYEVRPFICQHYQCNKTVEEFALDAFKEDPDYAKRKRHYINMRLTFFGADGANTLAGQLEATRMMAFKQKAVFGAHTDEWL